MATEIVAGPTPSASDAAVQATVARSPRHEPVRARPHHHFSASGDALLESAESNTGGTPSGMKHSLQVLSRSGSGILGVRPSGSGSGLSLRSAVLPLVNIALALLLVHLQNLTGTKQRDLLFLYYQPFAPMLGMLWLWGVNVRYFERHGVRYDVCFSAEDQRHLLPAAAIFQIANALSLLVLGSAVAFLLCCVRGDLDAAALHPPLIYLAMLGALLFPGGVLHRDSRRFFAATAWRVITPLRGVTWADFLLADVLTSLAKALSDTERAVCHLMTGPVMSPLRGACDDTSLLIPAGLALPYAWRLVQCLRVHADTGARPQLWNALKYATAFPVIALSFAKYHVVVADWKSTYKPAWLAAALVNSAYSFYWDVERDWEVGFFSQMGHQGRLVPAPVLSSALLYPRPFYWYLMASNAALRLSWIYKLSPHLRANHHAVFGIVLAEAFRRFQWMFVRIEVELRKVQAARPELGQLVPAPAHGGGAAAGVNGVALIGLADRATALKRDASEVSLADAKL